MCLLSPRSKWFPAHTVEVSAITATPPSPLSPPGASAAAAAPDDDGDGMFDAHDRESEGSYGEFGTGKQLRSTSPLDSADGGMAWRGVRRRGGEIIQAMIGCVWVFSRELCVSCQTTACDGRFYRTMLKKEEEKESERIRLLLGGPLTTLSTDTQLQ